jgi:hypothetical protein
MIAVASRFVAAHSRAASAGCLAAALATGCTQTEKASGPALAAPSTPCPDAGSGAPGSGGGAPSQPSAEGADRSPVAGTVLFAFDQAGDIAAAQPSTQPNNLNAQTTLGWDGKQGDPDDGSLRIEAPFSAYNQQIDIQFPLPTLTDLTGKVLYVRIRLGDGFNADPSAPGGMIFYAQSGDDYAWGQAEWTNVEQSNRGKWREYSFEMDFPWREVTSGGVSGSSLGFDPARVRLLGLILHTGGGGSSTILPTPAVFHVDSFGFWDPEMLE